ncbi:MAG: hypothetical protein AABZ55_01775 [Bdellovibrionota bacterium]
MPGVLKPNPVTGFLESPNFLESFNSDKKIKFLELIENNPHYNGIVQACELIGITPTAVFQHLKRDPVFYEKWENLKRNFAYRVEGVLSSCALDPKKTIDRLAYLRAYMSEKYNPGANTPQNGTVTINIEILDSARDHQRIVADAVTRIDESEVVEAQQVASHESLPSTNTTSTVEDTEHNDHYRK